jgi:hypothetical protein
MKQPIFQDLQFQYQTSNLLKLKEEIYSMFWKNALLTLTNGDGN